MCHISGKIISDDNWNTSVRKKEIAAEITPFPSAVKNEEPQMLKPKIKNMVEYMRKPRTVMANNSAS